MPLSQSTPSTPLTRSAPSAWPLRARLTLMAAVCMLLCGCAGALAFREGNALMAQGQVEQGLARLQEAVKLEPGNAEYRMALSGSRTSAQVRLLTSAAVALREGQLTEAEKLYRQVQAMDALHPMARQGLHAVSLERRHRLEVAEAEALFKQAQPDGLAQALERLRAILAENPQHKGARHLKARIEEAMLQQQRPQARLAAAFRKPITLEFRDAPLRSIMEVVSKVSGLNFFYDKDIRPDLKATIFARHTTIEDAMRLLMVTHQLEHKVLGENAVLIYPSTPQKLKDYQTLTVRSFFLANADVKAVSNTLKTILKSKDVVTDERLGIIIMRDTPEAVRMAERIVALQDLSDPEVMLEVEILEVKRTRLLELGVQWPSQVTLKPLQMGDATLTLEDLRYLGLAQSTTVSTGNFLVNARKEDQDANLLANPRIRVRNKEKAKIQIGDRVPVITTTSTSTGFVSESINYVDVGLKLEVEPTIYLDEEVAIKVNLEVSNLVREIVSKSGTLSYQIGSRGANTVLRLQDGETQVLAGLISDEDRSTANKLPGLGELPIAGRLFGNQKDDKQRSEILLSITPRIVRSIRRPDMLAAEFESGTESGIGISSLRMAVADGVPQQAGDSPAKAPAGSDMPAAAPGRSWGLSWQAPAEVRVGEQFSAVLWLNSQGALRSLPVLLGFDPQVLQVVSVQEGAFFRQNNARTSFSQRVDAAQGKVFVASVREAGAGAGTNGKAGLVTVHLRALRPAADTRVQLLSATPEPAQDGPAALPLEHVLRVVP